MDRACGDFENGEDREMFACLPKYRRLVVYQEYHLKNFLAMIQLDCILFFLMRVLG